MSAARWRCQSDKSLDKTSEANVLVCKTFDWSSYFTNHTFVIARFVGCGYDTAFWSRILLQSKLHSSTFQIHNLVGQG